jgi:hypothetical protein
MAYVSRSCDLLKKEILMAYISNHQIYLGKITQKGNLIDYISSQKRKIFPKNPENSKKILKNYENFQKWKYSPEDAKQTPINSEI